MLFSLVALLGLLTGTPNAHAADEPAYSSVGLAALQGTWTRVLQRCPGEVSEQEIENLFVTGGDPWSVSRRMEFYVHGDRWTATSRGSLRCGKDYSGPKAHYTHCGEASTSEGYITDVTEDSFRMVATKAGALNTWGELPFEHWNYRRHGGVLELSSGPPGECLDGKVYIFMIPPPLAGAAEPKEG